LKALEHRIDSYIFQGLSVPQILSLVLAEGLASFDREVRMDLTRDYAEREYCVQHEESDFAFISRLMEHEGISYYFDCSGEKEKLVLVDQVTSFQDGHTIDEGPIPILAEGARGSHVESIRHFHRGKQLKSSSVTVKVFDWTQPELKPKAEAKNRANNERNGTSSSGEWEREVYEHSGVSFFQFHESDRKYERNDVAVQAKLRKEALTTQERHAQAPPSSRA